MGFFLDCYNFCVQFPFKVNEWMEKPPFNFPNALQHLGGHKQVRLTNKQHKYLQFSTSLG